MKKLLLIPLVMALSGCTSFKVKTETTPDGKITIREITRWSFMAGSAFETVDIPGVGKLQGYNADGGKGSLAEVGGIVGQATEGAVRGALKSQGK
jgi:hypothetical protein